MIKQVTIRFFLRLDFKMQSGKIPIYARVILDREKFDFSSRQYLNNLSEWDEITQRVKYKCPINKALAEIEHEVNEAYNFLKYHNRPLTVYALRKQLKGAKQERLKFIDFVEDHVAVHIKGNAEYALATQKTYSTTISHLRKYLETSKKIRMNVAEVDLDTIKEFDDYLRNRSISEKKGVNKNSANKYHVNLKSLLFKAVDQKIIEHNPYRDFSIKSQQGRLTYLTSNELKRLEEHDLCRNASLERVRDIFLFSVYTGLRHSDASSLRSDNIEFEGNSYWIIYKQQKTQEHNRIPMLKKALDIYNKYENERSITGFVLPRLSNQKLNIYLKTIANLVGINKPMSHHVARHTAATTIFLQNGISLETTGKFLGHRSIKSTQIYAKVTNLMLKNAINELNNKLI